MCLPPGPIPPLREVGEVSYGRSLRHTPGALPRAGEVEIMLVGKVILSKLTEGGNLSSKQKNSDSLEDTSIVKFSLAASKIGRISTKNRSEDSGVIHCQLVVLYIP